MTSDFYYNMLRNLTSSPLKRIAPIPTEEKDQRKNRLSRLDHSFDVDNVEAMNNFMENKYTQKESNHKNEDRLISNSFD